MTDKMQKWNDLRTVPAEHLKTIKGGRLNGKSDINPQWRLQRMTEVFGPCGEGWRYSIDKLWTEPGDNGEVCAFALVTVHAGGEAIPGIGGSMLIAREQGGLHTSDEAYKMAVTDALSVAFKALGVAADIYLGKWDGSKYKTDATPERKNEPTSKPTPPPAAPTAPAAPAQQAAPADNYPEADAHAPADPAAKPAHNFAVDAQGNHFCTTHNTRFYLNEKNGKKWYSHKIKEGPGAGGYCNEPQE